jgi:hypothetical protein
MGKNKSHQMTTWTNEGKKIIKHYKNKMLGITAYIFNINTISDLNSSIKRHEIAMWIKSKTKSFLIYKKHMPLTERSIGLGRKYKKILPSKWVLKAGRSVCIHIWKSWLQTQIRRDTEGNLKRENQPRGNNNC